MAFANCSSIALIGVHWFNLQTTREPKADLTDFNLVFHKESSTSTGGDVAWSARLKRLDLFRHLEGSGCVLVREGPKHSVYYNPATQRTGTVPRHREVKNPTAVRICKQLGVPDPLR